MTARSEPGIPIGRRRLLELIVGAGVLGSAAACAPAPSPTPKPAAPPPAPTSASTSSSPPPASKPTGAPSPAKAATAPPTAKAAVKWKHAHVPLLIHSAFMEMGKEKGYFAEQGIDIEFSSIQDGVTALKGVVSGEIDSAGATPSASMIAIGEGAPIKLIGTVVAKVTNYLYAKTDIKSMQDLYGKNVGVGSTGAFLYSLGTGAMKRAGLDPDKVNWVTVGTSNDVWTALVAQKIDAGVSNYDVYIELPKYPYLHVVTSYAEALPLLLYDAFQVTDKTLAERKDVLVRTMTAMTKGVRYAIEHKNEFAALAKRLTARDDAAVNQIHDAYLKNHIIETNLGLTAEAVAFTQQFSIDAGQQKEALPYTRVATEDIAKAVIASLGEHKY